jgi:PEP-CTERM motif
MRSKLTRSIAAVGWALALSVGAANADTITTFNVSAQLFNLLSPDIPCPDCTLGGNIVINTTAGTVVSEDVTTTGLTSFFNGEAVDPYTVHGSVFLVTQGPFLQISIFVELGQFPDLLLNIPATTLVGYTGGPICGPECTGLGQFSISTINLNANAPAFGVIDAGSLTSIGSAVPEPSTWAMMLIGFAGLGFVARRRQRRCHGSARLRHAA